MSSTKSKVSEFTSYIWIKSELNSAGWNTRHPSRNSDGQLYTQQECHDVEYIKEQLGLKKPEYVIKLSEDQFYVIEAKGDVSEIEKAFKEAKDYAKLINNSEHVNALIVSGVAGNDDDGYLVKSAFYVNGQFRTINYHGKEITSLVSPALAKDLIDRQSNQIEELKIDEAQLLKIAEEINEVLHLGSINKDERASVMATLLLALIDDTKPNYNASASVFVKDINARAEEVLISHNKRDFLKHIEVKLPSNKEAQNKYKKALVSTIFKLKKIDIQAAMKSGTDILGKFYEVFLKYGNGAKDIGIVLTPRHIAKFACSAMNITHHDVVYDPTCGTGGFLVSAFDHVRENSSKKQLEEFKKHRIFGIEQQPKVAALAIVNMIFRGDGSNHIIDDNCLSRGLVRTELNSSRTAEYTNKNPKEGEEAITRVLMNPPFALKDKDEKEYKFVQHALDQMEEGGLLFAVLPLSVLLKAGAIKSWRKDKLLGENTVLSVITLPPKLFYPVGVHTCGIFIRKGEPHKKDANILWLRCMHDGYFTKKGKRLFAANEKNDLDSVLNNLKLFFMDQKISLDNIPEFQKSCPINWEDKTLELVPEAYLDISQPSFEEASAGMDNLVREAAAFAIKMKKESEIQ
ncbi:HsdM family class I SAM-dependent methyltransferase [Thiomicrorhabdus sp.]|uniref:HsdM family class I SAM-dependent methyltransferase n=1 Tax=Thiomicrorhabdus sp. TaxID=2039724 RepID=UPI002AA68B0D|nr:N-6 DNA methylase [Thiomicrorhabdus sp.]